MKLVRYNNNGRPAAVYLPQDMEETPENIATGIPVEIPNLTKINWGHVRKALEEVLIDNNVLDINSFMQHGNYARLTHGVLNVIMPTLQEYFIKERDNN